MIFCQKNPPQGDLFLMTFWALSGGHFFGDFSENFLENFSENFLGNFLMIFSKIFEEIFSIKFPHRKQAMTLTYSNAGRIDDELLISVMSALSSCKRAVARPRASSNPVTPRKTL
jgi:hypothetical protein